ncbi:hypothetical protein H257_12720 [Aphanomyces astaci]|uniref:Uncharacterized protein n=1 Tax=Aphanomyces astaci TaxID=112090 RepID=W4FXN7_APHAT|nr:hypothetical protein H257_12720 [Aphanomyces astaci]ETV72257.1 hypothetical protein H257_12720 [Aphanomyces astaci]|eukprot:XP_009838325.1 hypothetical protein H257_12720 [Aphanomyces astaci]
MKIIHGCRADAVELYRVEGVTYDKGTQVVFNGTPVDASTCTLATFGGSTTQMVDGSKVSAISTRPMRTTLKGFTYWWSPRALWFNLERSKQARDDGVGVVAFSSVKWLDVKDVFEPTPYTQPSIELPPENLDFQARYLKMASTC